LVKTRTSGCLLNGKDVLAVYQLVWARVPYFNCSFVSKSICRKTRPVFYYYLSDSRSKINGFDSEFSSRSFTWRRGCGEISIVILVSLFVCCFRFSGDFCHISSIKVYRLPKLQIFLARGLQTRSEKFSSRSMEIPVFFKTSANTTPRQSFLLEGMNRFSLDKYPSF